MSIVGRTRYSGVRITGGPPTRAAEPELPLVRLILIVRSWSAAARRGRLRGGVDVRCPRTPATRGSSGVRIARDIAAGTSSARGTAWSPPSGVATVTTATRHSRTTAFHPRVLSPPATARPSTPTCRTPCRPPEHSWRGRVAVPPRPVPGFETIIVAFPKK